MASSNAVRGRSRGARGHPRTQAFAYASLRRPQNNKSALVWCVPCVRNSFVVVLLYTNVSFELANFDSVKHAFRDVGGCEHPRMEFVVVQGRFKVVQGWFNDACLSSLWGGLSFRRCSSSNVSRQTTGKDISGRVILNPLPPRVPQAGCHPAPFSRRLEGKKVVAGVGDEGGVGGGDQLDGSWTQLVP